jgi:acetylglutamate kinase
MRVSAKRSSDNLVVVKIGGSTLGSHDTTLDDLVTLQKKGITPVVVHGGGSKITEWLKRMGLGTEFVRGMRVTDAETLQVVVAVLAGLVNKELVAAITARGGKAIGLSGVDGGLIQAKVENSELGYVGEVVNINPEPIKTALSAGYIPVVAPVGLRLDNSVNDPVALLNINGDAAASEIAAALKSERLKFLTDVPGVRDSAGKFLPKLSVAEARSMINSGVISGGMIPKVEACLKALSKVLSTQIIDGRAAGALLAAVERNEGGTRIE